VVGPTDTYPGVVVVHNTFYGLYARWVAQACRPPPPPPPGGAAIILCTALRTSPGGDSLSKLHRGGRQ
jgi:hypothetical protein